MENYVNLWEPPDADPLVRWCERSGACRPLLLDWMRNAYRGFSFMFWLTLLSFVRFFARIEVTKTWEEA